MFAILLAAGHVPASHAEGYPERTIKIVVPFPAGGPTDVAARLIAQSISNKLGQGVVVENHAGAGGRIGAKVVAGAAPDGYTLLLGGTNVNAIAGAIYKDLGFDPIDSFAPIAADLHRLHGACGLAQCSPPTLSRSWSNTPRTIPEN